MAGLTFFDACKTGHLYTVCSSRHLNVDFGLETIYRSDAARRETHERRADFGRAYVFDN